MTMTLSTSNYSTTLGVPQFTNFAPMQQPGSQLLESLAGLFAALAPLMQGLGFQGNPTSNRFGNNFPQSFGPQGFPQGFGPQGFPQGFGPQGFGPQGFPQTTGFNGINPFNSQLFVGQQPMTQDRATQVLKENWDKASKLHNGDKITRESLQDAMNDPNASQEFKDAAQYFLGSDQAFKNLDRANATKHGNYRQKADGDIARVDLDAALEGIPFTATEQQVAKTLADNLTVLGNGNNVFNQGDLAKILATGQMPNGQPASPAMLAAAQYVAANPAFFNKLEETYLARNPGVDGPRRDGLVGIEDLQAAIGKR